MNPYLAYMQQALIYFYENMPSYYNGKIGVIILNFTHFDTTKKNPNHLILPGYVEPLKAR